MCAQWSSRNRDSPTRVMIEEMDEAYGGINVVQVQVDSE